MADIPGIIRPELKDLPKVVDRMTFLYLEHCQINRQDGAITILNDEGVAYVPAASISVLLLGPGTNISHRAVQLIGDAGVCTVWVGENGVRYYASGRALNSRTGLLLHQAEMVSNTRKHVAVVRKMYQMRFPGEDVSRLTTQQLRGREGTRIRSVYRRESRKWGVPWSGRDYDKEDFDNSDDVNKSLSVGNACLYGLAQAVICALGCSAGLGFVHVGLERSFVYDIADLYKADVTIPIAFEIASRKCDDIESETRHRVRDAMVKQRILEKMVHDIRWLLNEPANAVDEPVEALYLWDNKQGTVPGSVNYAPENVDDFVEDAD